MIRNEMTSMHSLDIYRVYGKINLSTNVCVLYQAENSYIPI